ncbi:MAG TPA: AAA family ATPase [Candidatus Babeliales bacterium]|nr:AAA family ATPase [Candidatus Babeliales bacterium]
MNTKKLFLTLVVLASSFLLNSRVCTFENMIGECEEKAGITRDMLYFINHVKKEEQSKKSQEDSLEEEYQGVRNTFLRKLLLHGTPGNGKSLQAQEISKESGSPIHVFLKENIDQPTPEQNLHKIRKHIENATEEAKSGIVPIVLFEELHKMPTYVVSFLRQMSNDEDYRDSVQFIFTTNKLNKLDDMFVEEFEGNTAGYYDPDEAKRMMLLGMLLGRNSILPLPKQLEYMTDKTDGCNVAVLVGVAKRLKEKHDAGKEVFSEENIDAVIKKEKENEGIDDDKKSRWETTFRNKVVNGKVSWNNPIQIDENWIVRIVPQK